MTPDQQRELDNFRAIVGAGRGLTARDWGRFDWLEMTFDPDAYKKRKEEGHRRWIMGIARELSAEDLRALLAEKETEQSTCEEASA